MKPFARERHITGARDLGAELRVLKSAKYTLQFIDAIPLLVELLLNGIHRIPAPKILLIPRGKSRCLVIG